MQDIWYSMKQDMTYVRPCLFDHLLVFVFRSWTIRSRAAGVGGVGAVVLRAATGPAVVQPAEERPLPMRWYCVDRCVRGWVQHQPAIYEQVFTRLRLKIWQKCHLSIYPDHKRLDYVLEQQVLTTSSETHDVEVSNHPILWCLYCWKILTVLGNRRHKRRQVFWYPVISFFYTIWLFFSIQ